MKKLLSFFAAAIFSLALAADARVISNGLPGNVVTTGNVSATSTLLQPKNPGFNNSPTHSLSFMNGVLPPELTFTRSGTIGSYYNATGTLITSNTANTPRFDYNPVAHTLNGMLVEQASTNLLWPSIPDGGIGGGAQQWRNGDPQCSGTINQAVSPDGANNATLISDSSNTTSFYYGSPALTLTSGTTYTFSIYAKKNAQSVIQLATSFSNNVFANFDLNSCSPGSVGSSITSSLMSYQSVGNGWCRLSITGTPGSTASGNYYVILTNSNLSAARAPSYTGTGVGAFYVYGAQLETNVIPTSYIPTTSATVTRNIESVSESSPSWFYAKSGTLQVEAIAEGINTANKTLPVSFNDGTTANQIAPYLSTAGLPQAGIIVSSTEKDSGGALAAISPGIIFKQALSYSSGSNLSSANGLADTAGTFAASTLPTVSQLNVGDNGTGVETCNCWERQINYWNTNFNSPSNNVITSGY